jgi:tRNA (cmo5U34)-methyltransferase
MHLIPEKLTSAFQEFFYMKELKKQFDIAGAEYDVHRSRLIPDIDGFYSACYPLIKGLSDCKSMLDLGAGTGLFSYYIWKIVPELEFTLTDLSDEMLSIAKKRFAGADNFSFAVLDYIQDDFPGKFDIIISGLSIHRMDDSCKEIVYNKIFNSLNEGGIFINADQVAGRTAGFDCFYKTAWREFVLQSDLDDETIAAAFKSTEPTRLGKLESQLQMLERAGFSDVDCIYKKQNFVVFGGSKGHLCY